MSKKFELLRPALTVGGWALSGHPTAAPRVSAARQKGTPDIGSGGGWKRVQRMALPSLHVTEFQHMLRSEIIHKRRSSASGAEGVSKAKRISGSPFRCGSTGGSPLYQSVSQGVDGWAHENSNVSSSKAVNCR